MLKVCARHEYEEIERERRGEEGRQKKKDRRNGIVRETRDDTSRALSLASRYIRAASIARR